MYNWIVDAHETASKGLHR